MLKLKCLCLRRLWAVFLWPPLAVSLVMHVNYVARCRPVVRRRNMNEFTSLFLYYDLSGRCYSVSLTERDKLNLPPGCEMENSTIEY